MDQKFEIAFPLAGLVGELNFESMAAGVQFEALEIDGPPSISRKTPSIQPKIKVVTPSSCLEPNSEIQFCQRKFSSRDAEIRSLRLFKDETLIVSPFYRKCRC